MNEIVIPSLVGALLVVSWYWLMDLLPPFRAARRAVPAPAAAERSESQPEGESAQEAADFTELLSSLVVSLILAKRQEATRIGILQAGKATAGPDVVAVQGALGGSHQVVKVSVDEALSTRYDILVSVGDQPGALPASILKVYNMNLKLEDSGQKVRIAVGTPKM